MHKNIVIIEPSSAGLKLIDTAINLNNKVYVLTHNSGDRIMGDHYLNQCEIIKVDTNNELAVKKKLEILNSKISINAIIPGFEYYVPCSSRMSEHFHLKGLPACTVDAMHYKHKMRKHLSQLGLDMPWFIIIRSMHDLKKAIDKIKFPCVIKPTHLSGSLHIVKVNNRDELEYYLDRLFNDKFTDLGRKMQGDILIEEYISGKEFSVEGYVHNNKIQFVSITDKYLGEEPHFVEFGHIVMADISPEIKKNLLDYADSVIRYLGISVGPFHCEIRLSERGPILIEIAARLVGDNISELIELSTGVSLAEIMVKGYLGVPIENENRLPLKQYSGVKFIYDENKAGLSFQYIKGIEHVSKILGFVRYRVILKRGDKIQFLTDHRARIAEIVFTGSTHEEVKSRLEFAECLLTVECMES